MIWLASYPRSGNTFFRIILSEVYGIKSSEFSKDPNKQPLEDYHKYGVVKTHLLPHELTPSDTSIPAVYLVRDGRDSLVSMAHQRKDILKPGTDFEANLREAIIAAKGSYFGGWSTNVSQWLERASIVIRFEDLIKNPIECVERIRPYIDLPEPDISKLPGFEDLREKDYISKFDEGNLLSEEEKKKKRKNFFRRGKVGGWKDEMPWCLERLFRDLHGDVMEELGYLPKTFMSKQRRILRRGTREFYWSVKSQCKRLIMRSS